MFVCFFSSSLQCISFVGQACFPRLPKLPCLYRSAKDELPLLEISAGAHACCNAAPPSTDTADTLLPLSCLWPEVSKQKQSAHLGLVRSIQELSFLLHAFCIQEWPDKNSLWFRCPDRCSVCLYAPFEGLNQSGQWKLM